MVEKGKAFRIFSNVLMILIGICSIAPFLLLIMSSVTDEQSLVSNGYSFFPKEYSLYAYKYLLADSTSMVRAYGISILVTAVGTVANLLLTTLYAYPLSRKDLPGRNIFAFYLFFTMLFSGGLVPSYIMWSRTFHINNTIFALIVPNLMLGAFNVIMMRTYFTTNIPDAVIEAARIDGAGEIRILYRIVLPMAMPIMATIGLLVGLAYWNDWQNGLYYLTDDRLFSVQVLLMDIQRNIDSLRRSASQGASVSLANLPSTGVRMAITVMGILPIMIIYPFVQKYFVKGIAIGAVKG
ncbi:MAG: carbohydrate ABC transporter permease [Acutalibacter sp.]|jgi:binding-protein-dependent transport system inner membrane component|uniref:carbohydrate ABC transporter permease n=1 Tax=Allofournierella sp. TaxID=1940256 RepID=UPI001F8DE167|nr:carbohydrate ABC transporter permease [Candidatus Acutalibacter stercoravium]